MTRLNVYAGPAGFYIIRGGPAGDKAVLDSRDGTVPCSPARRPGRVTSSPQQDLLRDPDRDPGPVVQRRRVAVLPRHPRVLRRHRRALHPDGEFSPIWNPEFFGNMIMVNGNTWPFQTVEQRRYRFRFLNGCQSRFLILDFNKIPASRSGPSATRAASSRRR